MDVPYLHDDELRSRAESFLDRHHRECSLPIPIEEIIELQLKWNIIPIPELFVKHDVDAWITRDMTAIYVDEYLWANRLNRCRFSFAHETGHAVLHQKIFRCLAFDSTATWKLVQAEIPDSSYVRLEYQANAFASYVLMPDDVLRDRLEVARAQVDEKAGQDAKVSDSFRRKVVIQILSKEFVVSEEAMRRRLEKADLLP